MLPETWVVFSILLVTILLFLSDKVRLDIIALSMLIALMLTKLVTPTEALVGFSQPVVIMIAGLFIIGGGLLQTGTARLAGNLIIKLGGRQETSLIAILMISVALLSAMMSSTGTVAVFLPIASSLAAQTGIHPARLLMPLSFAALLGGMLTLIGTPPNMIVSGQLKAAGLRELSFFSLTPIGLIILVVAILFMLLFGRHLLPREHDEQISMDQKHSFSDLAHLYNLSEELFQLKVTRDSVLIGRCLRELNLPEKYETAILSVQHDIPNQFGRRDSPRLARPDTDLHAGDILVVEGELAKIKTMAHENGLIFIADQQHTGLLSLEDIGLAEAIVPPRSKMIGKTIRESHFRERYHLNVLSVRRFGQKVEHFAEVPLRFADMLLIHGEGSKMRLLERDKRDFVVVNQPVSAHEKPTLKTYLALGIVMLVILLMSLEFFAPVTAVLLGAVLMVLSHCLTMEDAYRSINWESLILIACMMPMATALEHTGGVELISQSMVQVLGTYGPLMVMAGIFVLTSGFSLFISNTATTVLMSPIAFTIASSLELSPYPFLVVVAIAASAAFSTPIATPVNTMVVGPGGYRFLDFVKVGLPLQLLCMILALLIIPFFFPFIHP